MAGLASVLKGHKDESLSHVKEYELGLIKLSLSRWDSDLEAIRRETSLRSPRA